MILFSVVLHQHMRNVAIAEADKAWKEYIDRLDDDVSASEIDWPRLTPGMNPLRLSYGH